MDCILKQIGVLVLVWYTKVPLVEAGSCWQNRDSNGTCYGLIAGYSTEKDCCGSGIGVAFSEKFIEDNLFRYVFVTVPACKPCKEACETMKCERNRQCVPTADGTATCQCRPDCSRAYQGRVCGSDGRTYRTECTLLRKKCLSKKNLKIEYKGACQAMCRNVKCPKGKVCLTDRNGRSYCVIQRCPKSCPSVSGVHVCGTDKVTYSSVCHLVRAGCNLGRKISVAYLGPCRGASCENVKCPKTKSCVVDSAGMPRCILCRCDPGQGNLPICGSDGRRHKSWCHMRLKACQTKKLLTIDFSGKC